MIHHHFLQPCDQVDEIRKDDFEWWKYAPGLFCPSPYMLCLAHQLSHDMGLLAELTASLEMLIIFCGSSVVASRAEYAPGYMTRNMSYLNDFEEIDEGYVAFGGNPKGGKITGRCTIKTDHLGKFDGKADEGFFVGYSLTMLADSKLPTTFWAEAVNTACYKLDRRQVDDGKKVDEESQKEINNCNVAGTNEVNVVGGNISIELQFDPEMPALEDDRLILDSQEMMKMMVLWLNYEPHMDTTIQKEPKKQDWVAQGYTLRRRIDLMKSLPVARMSNYDYFLAYASFKDFVVYQMDVKSVFLYGKIEEEVYVCQPSGFEEPDFLDRVYKSRLQSAPWNQKPMLKDEDGEEVDVHMYRSMIGSLMYLTSSRPNIMFVVCAYARCQVNPKVSHLHVVKRVFRCQDRPWDTIAQSRFENSSVPLSNQGYLGLGEKKTKTTQHNEIASLKRRVKKLEKRNRSRTHRLKRIYKVGLTPMVESSRDKESLGEDASKQGRTNAIDADEEITLVSVQDDVRDKEMFDVDALFGKEVFVAGQNKNVVEEVVDVLIFVLALL
ncbi:retrovirus-related pol polyprotein from transposon TNT 1-94 [Tanacetum coccineum]